MNDITVQQYRNFLMAVALIYECNVNNQNPYEANPVSKRIAIGAFVYDVGATLWTVGKIAVWAAF